MDVLTILLLAFFLCDFSYEYDYRKQISINEKLSYNNLLELRGILSLVVIIHHLYVNYVSDRSVIGEVFSHLGYLCVGCFLFMSGLGLAYNQRSKGRIYLNTIPAKIKYFLCVYFATNVIYFILSPLYASYSDNWALFWNGLINVSPLAGSSWYLLDVIFLYLIFLLSNRFKKSAYQNICYIFLFVGLLLLYWLADFPLIWSISNLSFLVGILVGNYLNNNKDFHISICKILVSCAILFLAFSIVSLFPSINGRGKYLCTILSVPIFSLLVILIYCLFIPQKRLFSWIGKHGLEIFLIHVVVYKMLRGNVVFISNDFVFSFLTIIISILLVVPFSKFNKLLAQLVR